MDYNLQLQVVSAALEAAYLPPLVSIIKTNNEKLKEMPNFSIVMFSLIQEALAKLDILIAKQNPPIPNEERRYFILAGSATIVKVFNAALAPDYPNILVLTMTQVEDQNYELTINPFIRKELPGMHDCLRSEIIPVLTIQPTEDDNEVAFKILKFKIYPELTENSESEENPDTEPEADAKPDPPTS